MLHSSACRDSIIPLPAQAEPGGIPEVSSGSPSPPLAAYTVENERAVLAKNFRRALREGAAYTVTEECERLFCATLKDTFLYKGFHMMGMHNNSYDTFQSSIRSEASTPDSRFAASPAVTFSDISPVSPVEDEFSVGPKGMIEKYIEVYDYVGGARFRGFVAGKGDLRAIFVFFNDDMAGCDLKSAVMALLELCEAPGFDCSQLVVCLDRGLDATSAKALNRDLGWVGFEPHTLVDWTDADDILSDKWMFLNMET